MADLLGIHQVSYGRIENGVWVPSEEKLNSIFLKLKQAYPELTPEAFEKSAEKADSSSIRQKTVIGSNSVVQLERQRDEEKSDLKQIIETLKQEISEKNIQIKEKDSQIQRLIGIIENFRRESQVLGL